MRITSKQLQAIKQTIHNFDPQALIYLFGSRVDDNKKGGDIDLLVFSQHLDFRMQRKIKIKLYELIGEQKIDLIIAKDNSKPFIQLALQQAVLL
ncbi:nucleotidyltransferase domain-containing protein [Candidatus Marithrix sp. Canyon 246]|uniref:nucleotidyltransferase domain-containing protein n=1 Tax=Candidatus Marithrix sp. Canyon 246 TaxID=1827136 RepID=UPI00084A271F|nr:nucleotidyltransferase domain-containing protein [Candidatus Marithrix sp. Canyon 246]